MNAIVRDIGYVDMTKKEENDYSLCRAIRAAVDRDWKEAGLELEVSNEISKRAKRATSGFFLPSNLPVQGSRATSATAYGVTINAAQGGANLVATNLLASSFIDVLRNKTRVIQMGATMLRGLVGNVQIPRQDSGTATYWLTPEGADVTEGEVVFDSITMSPKTIGGRSQVTRQMTLQATPDIEMLIRNDLAAVMALGIDLAAIAGTGASGQPTGILSKAGVTTVALGTNGAISTIDNVIALETALMQANVDSNNIAYLTNATVIGGWKTLKDTTGRYLWADNKLDGEWGQRGGTPMPGFINGYPAFRSNQVPKNLTKGTGTGLSAIILGAWDDLLIGEWGVLEILANPFGAGFNSGSIDIRTLQSVDINVRHPLSFAVITDAIQ
jgi:HK97 family phage major capsid protein